MVIARFATCVQHHQPHGGGRHHNTHIACLDHPTQMLNVLGLLIEGLLFGMFTSCMMYDQSEVIRSKLTHIDRLKSTNGDSDIGGALAGVTEVFGIGSSNGAAASSTRFRWDWLSPFCRVHYPSAVVDDVMGFCRHIGGGGSRKSSNADNNNGDAEMTPLRKLDDVL